MKYTQSQVKSIGGKRYLKRKTKHIVILSVLSVVWVLLVNWLTTDIASWVYFAPIALALVNIIWGYLQSRSLLWKRYQKNPEILEGK